MHASSSQISDFSTPFLKLKICRLADCNRMRPLEAGALLRECSAFQYNILRRLLILANVSCPPPQLALLGEICLSAKTWERNTVKIYDLVNLRCTDALETNFVLILMHTQSKSIPPFDSAHPSSSESIYLRLNKLFS